MVFVLRNSRFKNCSGGEGMRIRIFTIILCSFLLLQCTNRKLTKKETAVANNCRVTWQYLKLKDTLRGEVLYHAKASFHCGVIATASETIVRTNLNDTVRILWLCNVNQDFKKSERVRIYPAQMPSFSVAPPVIASQFECVVRNTYFGALELLFDLTGLPVRRN